MLLAMRGGGRTRTNRSPGVWIPTCAGMTARTVPVTGGTPFRRRRCSRASQTFCDEASVCLSGSRASVNRELSERAKCREAQGTRAAGKPLPAKRRTARDDFNHLRPVTFYTTVKNKKSSASGHTGSPNTAAPPSPHTPAAHTAHAPPAPGSTCLSAVRTSAYALPYPAP